MRANYWTRLEPITQTSDINQSLAAPVHDPLWFLARQWQSGEFNAEDAGTPITVQTKLDVGRIVSIDPGQRGGETITVDDSAMPLETLVEREPLNTNKAKRLSLELGRRLDNMLRQAGHAKIAANLAQNQPFKQTLPELNDNSQQFNSWMHERFIDGLALRELAKQQDQTDLIHAVGSADELARIQNILKDWLDWASNFITEPASELDAWMPERLEYNFYASAEVDKQDIELEVDNYPGGHLDWPNFRVRSNKTNPHRTSGNSLTRTVMPTQVSYPGMPNKRFWEFEDGQVSFTAIQGGPDDLGRILLIDYAVSYSNDWFVIPIDMPIGSLTRVRSVVSRDTFGVEQEIPASDAADSLMTNANAEAWRMFNLSDTRGNATEWFLLPASLGSSLESIPREKVNLLRDEMANKVWAVEEVLESPDGQAHHLRDTTPNLQGKPPADRDYDGQYTLMTDVPDHWYPLVAVNEAGEIASELQLRKLARGQLSNPEPMSALLRVRYPGKPKKPFTVHPEEISMEGVGMQRSWQTTRWLGGKVVTWSTRKRTVGRTQGASGLRYDKVD